MLRITGLVPWTLLVGAALVGLMLVALLLSDAMAPGRLPPLLGFWGASAAGGLGLLGLLLLGRRPD